MKYLVSVLLGFALPRSSRSRLPGAADVCIDAARVPGARNFVIEALEVEAGPPRRHRDARLAGGGRVRREIVPFVESVRANQVGRLTLNHPIPDRYAALSLRRFPYGVRLPVARPA